MHYKTVTSLSYTQGGLSVQFIIIFLKILYNTKKFLISKYCLLIELNICIETFYL